MKSIKTTFALFIAMAIFSSCQKEFNGLSSGEPSSSPANSASSKVKTYTEDVASLLEHTVTTFNVSYDNENRLASLISVTSPGDKFIYQYLNNTFSVDIYNSNQLSIHSVYFINSLSLVDSSWQYNDTQDTMTEKYLYNSGNQLIQQKEYDYASEIGSVLSDVHYYSYDDNGNLLKDSTASAVTSYEYYNDLLDNLSMGSVYSRRNKNLVKKTTYSDGSIIESTAHTYTFDNYSRQTSEKAAASTGEVVVKSYTY